MAVRKNGWLAAAVFFQALPAWLATDTRAQSLLQHSIERDLSSEEDENDEDDGEDLSFDEVAEEWMDEAIENLGEETHEDDGMTEDEREDEEHDGQRTRRLPVKRVTMRDLDGSGRVPYILRMPSTYLRGAELSWDGAGHNKALATVEYNDPVPWTFHGNRGSGYTIKSQYPRLKGAELSWDGYRRRYSSSHARASVEYHDPVKWKVEPRGRYFKIKNLYPGTLKYAELSWDGIGSRSKAYTSVERYDPVNWEIIPKYTVKGEWKLVGTVHKDESRRLWHGFRNTNSWSSSSTFGSEVTATANAGGTIGAFSFGGSVSATVKKAWTKSVSGSVEKSSGWERTRTYKTYGQLWQWVITVQNNHFKYRNQRPVIIKTTDEALSEYRGKKPACLPGYCSNPAYWCTSCYHNGNLPRR